MSLILSGTDGLSDVDGTVSTPAIRGTDSNTGIFFPAADTIAFSEGGAEAMRIDSDGNVGIGTTSPTTYGATTKLAVVSTGTAATWLVGGTSSGAYAYFSNNAQSSTANTMQIGQGWATGSDNIGFLNTNGANPLLFATNGAERMRIDSSGNLLVNGTTQYAKLTVARNNADTYNYASNSISNQADHMLFLNGGTTVGSIQRFGGSAVVYNTTSDRRLKSNIVDANPVLNKLMDVKVRQFDWTKGGLHQEAGFIAQELEPILSGVVTKGKTENDIWQLDYARITPYLVKAIQEQQALIENLTTRLTALENK